jgi:hypothetical protein
MKLRLRMMRKIGFQIAKAMIYMTLPIRTILGAIHIMARTRDFARNVQYVPAFWESDD